MTTSGSASATPGGAAATQAIRPQTKLDQPEVAPVGDRSAGWRRRIAYVFLIGYALLMFVPFAWTVVTSFKTQADSVRLTFIPDPVSLRGWENAFTQLDPAIPVLFVNSFAIALAVTFSNVILGSMAGYAFARLRFPGREFLFLLVLATMMIPDQLRLVPVYQILRSVGLLAGDLQYIGVVLVLAIAAPSIFLLRQYFMSIPAALEEAAKLDGAGYFKTFRKVMLPLAGPALAAVTILQFQGTWNEFFWPLIILQDESKYTLPLGISTFVGIYDTQWPELMAASVIAILPVAVIFVLLQRYFIAGVAAAGVKG